ncbi:hypothetical protein ACFL1H_08240, partial [Nanoarchaeota archaeon]
DVLHTYHSGSFLLRTLFPEKFNINLNNLGTEIIINNIFAKHNLTQLKIEHINDNEYKVKKIIFSIINNVLNKKDPEWYVCKPSDLGKKLKLTNEVCHSNFFRDDIYRKAVSTKIENLSDQEFIGFMDQHYSYMLNYINPNHPSIEEVVKRKFKERVKKIQGYTELSINELCEMTGTRPMGYKSLMDIS